MGPCNGDANHVDPTRPNQAQLAKHFHNASGKSETYDANAGIFLKVV